MAGTPSWFEIPPGIHLSNDMFKSQMWRLVALGKVKKKKIESSGNNCEYSVLQITAM